MKPRPIRPSGTILGLAVVVAIAAGSTAVTPARAQVILDKNLQDPDKRGGRPATQPNFTNKAVAPWPRLDPGAVMCSTRGDLDQHHRAVQARLSGEEPAPSDSPNCRRIGTQTPIDVVTRAAPSATEIRLRGATTTAWTDTWLPTQPPR